MQQQNLKFMTPDPQIAEVEHTATPISDARRSFRTSWTP